MIQFILQNAQIPETHHSKTGIIRLFPIIILIIFIYIHFPVIFLNCNRLLEKYTQFN